MYLPWNQSEILAKLNNEDFFNINIKKEVDNCVWEAIDYNYSNPSNVFYYTARADYFNHKYGKITW